MTAYTYLYIIGSYTDKHRKNTMLHLIKQITDLRNAPNAQIVNACDDWQLWVDANGYGYVIDLTDYEAIYTAPIAMATDFYNALI